MPRIRPTRFVHVVYRTRQFERMIQWYRTVLDCTVRHQTPVLAFLSYDEEHHRIALLNLAALGPAPGGEGDGKSAGAAPRHPVGVDHVAYTYASADDLLENYAQLRDQGIRPYWCVHHGVTMSMYYADPDGNQMEFQVDAFATAAEADAYMRGPHFAANPIGTEYDPEEMLARLRAGAPGSSFLPRAADLPVSPIRGALAS